jgi:hypothetical protein
MSITLGLLSLYGESGFVLNLLPLDLRKIKSRKPPEGTQTPPEASHWHLLVTPSHDLLQKIKGYVVRSIFPTGALQAHPDMEVGKTGEIFRIRRVMTNQDTVRFQNKLNFFGNELKNLQKVRPIERGLIAADSRLVKSFLSGNREEVSDYLFRRIKPASLFGLSHHMPGPTEKTFQTTPRTVSRGNSSVKRSSTEPIILPLLSRANNSPDPFGQYQRIKRRAIHRFSSNSLILG